MYVSIIISSFLILNVSLRLMVCLVWRVLGDSTNSANVFNHASVSYSPRHNTAWHIRRAQAVVSTQQHATEVQHNYYMYVYICSITA
jgi:hypothetical protein